MTMRLFVLRAALPVCILAAASFGPAPAVRAATLVEDFEGQSAGSGTPPAGWTLITNAGSPTYTTTAAGQGSNGAGGSSGLAGQVSSTAFNTGEENLPGAYLVNSTVFDVTEPISGSFDVLLPHEEGFDDVTFNFGDIDSSFAGAPAGQLLSVKLIEGSSENRIANGANAVLDGVNGGLSDETWYHVTFDWAPTSGATGDFSLTVNDFSTDVLNLSTTGYTFDSSAAQFGFGSVNDTIRFDNVNIATVPEPSTFALAGLGLGLLALMVYRRRG